MKRFLLFAFLLAALILSACGSPGYASYRGIPPPPAPRRAVIGVAPGPGYVWADGNYDLRGRNWVWAPGRWARPPHRRSTWVPGQWTQSRRGWRFHRGHWR